MIAKNWIKRCGLMARATSSKSKKKYLASVMAQMAVYSGQPTQAQEVLLSQWWRHYLRKTKSSVVEQAEQGVAV